MQEYDTILRSGEMLGCPNVDSMKRWYWSLAQGYVEENFLFIASAYFLVRGIQRGERPGERMKLLFDDFICSNYGPLYVNVASNQRSRARNIVNANAYDNLGYSIPALAQCVEEVGFMVQAKMGESKTDKGSLPNSLRRYDKPRKKVESKWWQQRFFGANKHYWIPVRHKSVPSDKIELVMDKWGPSPWLYHLRQMS